MFAKHPSFSLFSDTPHYFDTEYGHPPPSDRGNCPGEWDGHIWAANAAAVCTNSKQPLPEPVRHQERLLTINSTTGCAEITSEYPEYQLFEETVYKDISFGPKNMGLEGEEIDCRVRRAAAFAGIDEEMLEKSPFELSGGQKRRVAIAGVIAMEPKVLILDEPTAGLDPRGREAILAQLRSYHTQKGNTVILVSHSMEEIARNVDRIVVMSHSHKLMDGTPEEVFCRAGELLQVGLDVPQVTKVAMELQKRGLLADSSVYTIDELVRRLLALKGGEAAC